MQAERISGYITKDGELVINSSLSLPSGDVEVIILHPEFEQTQQRTYTQRQKETLTKFLQSAGAIKNGDPRSSVKVDEVVYGGK